jgi:hypothetical protein
MQTFSYLIPQIGIAPPAGYSYAQFLNLEKLRDIMTVRDATLTIEREVVRSGESLSVDTDEIVLRNGEWVEGPGAEYYLDSDPEWDWTKTDDLAYVQTRITSNQSSCFNRQNAPSFYAIYSGEGRKTFFSDNALKMCDAVVIQQVDNFQKWCDGYAACEVDPSRDVDESIVMINPYGLGTVVTVFFQGLDFKARIRVDAYSSRRTSLSDLLGERAPWSGHLFVHGPRRVINFHVNHARSNPSQIATLEHFDIFRGLSNHKPFTQVLYDRRQLPELNFA